MIYRQVISMESSSIAIRNQMALDYVRLVKAVAARYGDSYHHIDKDDLFQAGFIGLLKAVEKYEPGPDPEHPRPLSTFAYSYIRGYVLEAIRHLSTTIHVSFDDYKMLKKIQKVEREVDAEGLTSVQLQRHVCKELHINARKYQSLKSAEQINQRFIGSQAKTHNQWSDEEESVTIEELVEDEVLTNGRFVQAMCLVRTLMRDLDPQDVAMMDLHMMTNWNRYYTYARIAEMYGVSEKTVQRKIQKVLDHVRARLLDLGITLEDLMLPERYFIWRKYLNKNFFENMSKK
jgi:RNA polymerase sigma factor (sigma-70 family)